MRDATAENLAAALHALAESSDRQTTWDKEKLAIHIQMRLKDREFRELDQRDALKESRALTDLLREALDYIKTLRPTTKENV